jgi:hypothetical protein
MATINSITYREVKFIPGKLALEVRAACKEAYKMNSDMYDILRGINYRLKEIRTGNDSTTDHHYRVAVSETGRQIDVIHLKANHDDDAVMITIIAE